jgi:hypothetical protein
MEARRDISIDSDIIGLNEGYKKNKEERNVKGGRSLYSLNFPPKQLRLGNSSPPYLPRDTPYGTDCHNKVTNGHEKVDLVTNLCYALF